MILVFTFYLPILICSLWLILLVLNYFFYEYRSTLYRLITNQSSTNIFLAKITIQTILPSLFVIFNLYNVFIFYLCLTYNTSTFLNLNEFLLIQLYFLNIVFNTIIWFFLFYKKLPLNIDFLIFFFFIILISQTLIIFNNLLNIFFVLEIINMLIIYSFINSITLRTFHLKNYYTTYWIIESCVYQFILNFVGSIIFYFFYNHLIINYFSVNLHLLSFISNFSTNWFIFNGLYFAFLVKFGIGPWLIYKLHMYKHFNIILLLIYTIIYFLTILIFFLNLFFFYKFILSFTFIYIMIIILLMVFYFILTYLFTYNNLLIFMSLSSLLNLSLILFQLSIITIMFK